MLDFNVRSSVDPYSVWHDELGWVPALEEEDVLYAIRILIKIDRLLSDVPIILRLMAPVEIKFVCDQTLIGPTFSAADPQFDFLFNIPCPEKKRGYVGWRTSLAPKRPRRSVEESARWTARTLLKRLRQRLSTDLPEHGEFLIQVVNLLDSLGEDNNVAQASAGDFSCRITTNT